MCQLDQWSLTSHMTPVATLSTCNCMSLSIQVKQHEAGQEQYNKQQDATTAAVPTLPSKRLVLFTFNELRANGKLGLPSPAELFAGLCAYRHLHTHEV